MRSALVAIALAGCLDRGATECADGTLCPAASVCLVGGGCALPGQVAACSGKSDGDSCDFAGSVGRCSNGACVGSLCGNGVVDAGEVCDDGNTTSGDGCRGDCLKIEVCGDGILDSGEQCDDGNHNPADGCDACVASAWRTTTLLGGSLNASSIGLWDPESVAMDIYGNLYVAESVTSRVWRVDPTGAATVVAGTGVQGFSGDGGPAASAELSAAAGVAVDGLGRIFVSDGARIRRVDENGIITTIAGSQYGYGGDGGPATAALLDSPGGVEVDGLGNVYIADSQNDRIRRIDPDGIITTIAGLPYVVTNLGDGGPATMAELVQPGKVVHAGGKMYIADTASHRIRVVDANGIITTLAGSGPAFSGGGGFSGDGGPATSALLWYPYGVAVDAGGNVFIADTNNNRIRRVDAATGIITTVVGTGLAGRGGDHGPATAAQLDQPRDVILDAAGNLYIVDFGNNQVRRVDTSGTITTVVGSGTMGNTGDGGAATSASLSFPSGLRVDAAGNRYIIDSGDHRVRKVDPNGTITTLAGTGTQGSAGDGGLAIAAQLDGPEDVAIDSAGNAFIADTNNHRIRRVDAITGVIATVAGTGQPGAGGDGGPATGAQLSYPWGIAIDAAGTLYIADSNNCRIRRVDGATGTITTIAGDGTPGLSGDGGPAINAQLAGPAGVALDALGNLFIADAGNARIRRIDPLGIISTVAGTTAGYSGDNGPATTSQLSYPASVAVDARGYLYIADYLNYRIRQVDASGVITTIAGSGAVGGACDPFDGDGGPATAAPLCAPQGIAVDAAGSVYFGDALNLRAREIRPDGTIATFAGRIDPDGMGPLAGARLADPRAIVFAAPFALVAGGTTGTLQLVRSSNVEVAAGRYPQPDAVAAFARYRGQNFGTVEGIAYDAAAQRIYLTESSANRVQVVTVVDPANVDTWTIAVLAGDVAPGFADGPIAGARFREPTGLLLDQAAQVLYIADTGNDVIRALDLTTSTVSTIAGTPQTRGYFGDGGAASDALLYRPQAIARCSNGDVFVADTDNHRIRRIANGTISTVLGVGVAASAGDGKPARSFPVDAPLGVACDALGNVFVTSRTTVRLLPADDAGIVDGSGPVQTIYRATASTGRCLTGIAVVDARTVDATDSCSGQLVQLQRD